MFLLSYKNNFSSILLLFCLLFLLSFFIPTATRAQNTEPPPGSIPPTLETAVPPVPDAPPPVTSGDYGGNRPPSYTLTLLSGIPFIGTETPTLAGLLQALYRIAIILGAVFAVVRITLAGIQYMGSDSFSSKSDAKKGISEVLIGLLILLSTVLILRTLIGEVDLNVFGKMAALPPLAQIPQNDGVIIPSGVTTNIKKTAGCQQAAGGGGSCPTGYIAVIKAKTWGCETEGDITPSPGQDAFTNKFRPMTESECHYNSMTGTQSTSPDANIKNGQIIGGVFSINSFPGSSAAFAQSLTPACQATLPGGKVTLLQGGNLFGNFIFICKK